MKAADGHAKMTRILATASVVLAFIVVAQTAPAEGDEMGLTNGRPIVGAIRWDAWHGDRGEPGKAVEEALGPAKWHSRVPFFGKVISDTQVQIRGYTQGIVDREIAYAHAAGLDYWGFVMYEPDAAMSLAFSLYLSSEHKSEIRFCMVTGPGNLGTLKDGGGRIARLARLMAEPNSQKVMGNRPLFYIGFIEDKWIEAWGGPAGGHELLDSLREQAKQLGAGNPYIVIMDFSAEHGKKLADMLGADAISAYATSAGGKGAPYADLARHTEGFWEQCKATGAKVVPIVMSGWDRRPRVERPMPWETWQKPGEGIEQFYEAPKPEELAAHLKRAVDWIRANPAAAPADAAIIYAWNENDEGGWLVPTLGEGTKRLDAIGKVLKAPP